MADYSDSKVGNRAVYPDRAVDAQEFQRLEPLLTAEELRNRVLFGIPLISSVVDPRTKKVQVMTDSHLEDIIIGAINQLEVDSGIDMLPVQRTEPHPFDRNTFRQYGYLKTEHSPITSVESIIVQPNDETALYSLPTDWISTASFNKGLIHITPILPSAATIGSYASTGNGAAFLSIMGQLGWMPDFWSITYTTGFQDGAVPRIVNEIIGCYAGIEILSMLAATNSGSTSRSTNGDGFGQSVSGPGPDRYKARIEDLDKKRDRLTKKLRAMYGKKFVMGTI